MILTANYNKIKTITISDDNKDREKQKRNLKRYIKINKLSTFMKNPVQWRVASEVTKRERETKKK